MSNETEIYTVTVELRGSIDIDVEGISGDDAADKAIGLLWGNYSLRDAVDADITSVERLGGDGR